MSFSTDYGLSINMYEPLVRGGRFLLDIADQVNDFSMTKSADLFYKEATLSINLTYDEAWQWIVNGLLRHIEIKNGAGGVVFEGFIDSMTVAIGGDTYEVGPITNIGNRVYAVYTRLYTSASAGMQVRGTSYETTLIDDVQSQLNYGIFEKCLNAGQCSITSTYNEADALRNTFLVENAYPKSPLRRSLSSPNTPKVDVNIQGYHKLLDAYIYNNRLNTASFGWSTISAKIAAILAANPNTWGVNISARDIASNVSLVNVIESNNKTALTILKGLASSGDVNGNRWLFGVGKDRYAYYRQAPSIIDYEYSIIDNRQVIKLADSNVEVAPWDVEPGRWMRTNDMTGIVFPLYTGLSAANIPLHQNSRYRFIENVYYSTPYNLEIDEGKWATTEQLLNYKGLGTQ